MEHITINSIKKKILDNRKDILILLVIFGFSLFFFKNFLGTETLMHNGHHLHEQTFFSYNYLAAQEQGTLPFWTPYWYSGQPLFGDSQVFFLNLTHIFLILFKNIVLAINLSVLIYFFVSGAGMYFLVKYLVNSRGAAFISSVIFMFNGLIYGFVVSGNPSILEPYSLIPLIFLFILKAKKAKNPINYSILAGILLVFQIFSGGALILLYTFLLIGAYFVFDLIGSKPGTKLTKTVIIGSILLITLFGLSAVKLLSNYDFIKYTNRANGLSYQEYIGEDYIVFSDLLDIVVLGGKTSSLKVNIGVTAFLLVLASLGFYRKKMVVFLFSLSIFVFFLASGGFLAEFFYNYVPQFSKTRHISRVIFIFAFAASVLAGYGFKYLSNTFSKKIRFWDRAKVLVIAGIVALILLELVFSRGLPKGLNVTDQLEENELANYLQQEDEKFRISTLDVDDLIAFFASSYYAQHELETLSGGGGLWINDFISYLGISKAYNNSKLLGILNLKYLTSTQRVNVSGFEEVKEFGICKACNVSDWTYWIAGPYLYENKDYLPRYYQVNHSILVLGNSKQSSDLVYNLMLNRNFNPGSAVFIRGKHENINSYDINFLKKFDAVILLSGSVDSNSGFILSQYADSGGKLFPNVLNNENSLDMAKIDNLLSSFEGSAIEVEHKTISQNEIELYPKNKGFIVLSEKFSLFDGWSARADSKNLEILNADNVISAVYVDGPGKIEFKYTQISFRKGLTISLSTLLAIVLYFFYASRKRKLDNK